MKDTERIEIAKRIEKIASRITELGIIKKQSDELHQIAKELRYNQRPTTWEEVEEKYFGENIEELFKESAYYPNTELWQASIAQFKIIWILYEMNGDWKPEQSKEIIWRIERSYVKEGAWSVYEVPTDLNRVQLLSFPCEEAANHFLTHYKDLIDQAKPLL